MPARALQARQRRFNTVGNLLRLRQRDQLIIRADIAGNHVKFR